MNSRIVTIATALAGFLWLFCSYSIGIAASANGNATDSHGSTPNPSIRVLLIGNSFTYFNDGIDKHLLAMAKDRFPSADILVDRLVRPNETLQGHYQHQSTSALIADGDWDFVVLQAASYETTREATLASFMLYSDLLAKLVREHAAEPLLFMTWPYRSRPEMLKSLKEGYLAAGRASGSQVAPVGLAWELARTIRPELNLYSDGRHPSMYGTYLSACVFFAWLFEQSPEQTTHIAGLPEADARFLQKVAWRTVSRFRGPSNGQVLRDNFGARTVAQ